MSNLIHSFDVLTMLAEEADKRFTPFFIRQETSPVNYESICQQVDNLLLTYSGVYFEIEIDEITLKIRITLAFDSASDELLDKAGNLLTCAEQIAFASVPAKSYFLITYHFPGIWKKNPELTTCKIKEV